MEPDIDKPSESSDSMPKRRIFKRLLNLLPLGRTPDTTEALEHEIQELLEEGEEQGLISPLEEKMINSIFDFRDTLTAEIMTPAVEIISSEESTPISELVALVIQEGFTRIPIYRENSDNIIGILHAKDLLKICTQTADQTELAEHLKTAAFVSEYKPIVDLLREFQKDKNHMAMVTDEFGTVRGLITLEDVLEEIVGEIDDEYDTEEDELEVIDENTIIVKARIDIEEVEEQFSLELPEGPYESVGGLILHVLGRIARVGDVIRIGNLQFDVTLASERHIKLVKITRHAVEDAEE
jgi:CBS domain containing-hemolysin-like protein